MKIELDLPDDILDSDLETEIVRRAIEDIVLRLFAERRIPSALSRRLLGLTRRAFMDLCQQRGVPLVDYTVEDLQGDIAALDRLLPQDEERRADDGRFE